MQCNKCFFAPPEDQTNGYKQPKGNVAILARSHSLPFIRFFCVLKLTCATMLPDQKDR